MTKTIEEAAWNFARKQWGKQVPHTIDKIAKMLLDKVETIAHNKGISSVHLEWEEVDTPKWMLDHYISRGYEEVEFCDGYALLKKPFNK